VRPGPSALERVLADVCLGEAGGLGAPGEGGPDGREGHLRRYLDAHGVAREDVDAIVAAPPRLAVYRSLVQNGLHAVIARVLPRTRRRMNASGAGRFDRDVARFLAEVGPRTHYLRDVPGELVAWCEPQWRADPGVPAYLPDLALHELAHFAVAASEDEGDAGSARGRGPASEVRLDRPILLAASARSLKYSFGVHELAAEEDSTELPAERAVQLLAYRDADHHVRWLDLTPLAAAIVDRLLAREPLGLAVERACATHGTNPLAVAADVARLLAELGERGVLLGGE
jgi:hypothetical protein